MVLVTLGSHGDDGLCRGVVLVLHPRVVLVQELRQRGRFGEQLADHVPADVGGLLEPQDAEDLRLDAVEPVEGGFKRDSWSCGGSTQSFRRT